MAWRSVIYGKGRHPEHMEGRPIAGWVYQA